MKIFGFEIKKAEQSVKAVEEVVTEEATTEQLSVVSNAPTKTATKNIANKAHVAGDDVEMPVAGGRSSIPEGYTGLGFYGAMMDLGLITPDFEPRCYDALYYLAKYNADLSFAVDNIVQLANTNFTIHYGDDVTQEMGGELTKWLRYRYKRWYNFSEGLYGLVGDLIAELAITGALSAEICPKDDLSGVDKIVKVAPKGIMFVYDPVSDTYKPFQKVVVFGKPFDAAMTEKGYFSGMKELNPVTFKYAALRRFGEKPYGIPPFLSAFENLGISKNLWSNMQKVTEKLGAMGFMHALVNMPTKLPSENAQQYETRCFNFLKNTIVPELDKGFGNGLVAGFKGVHEFNMTPTNVNVSGAKDLFEINDKGTMAGLKQDPAMLGRNFNTSETFGRVVLTKMTTQVESYQKTVASFLADAFQMELALAGFGQHYVEVIFDKTMVGDKLRDEQAYRARIENATILFDEGIISQQERAQMLGYEEPFQDEPRANGSGILGNNNYNPNSAGGNADGGTSPDKQPSVTKPKNEGKKKVNPITAKFNYKLPAHLQEQLAAMPETGMGYQLVTFKLKSGAIVTGAVVINGVSLVSNTALKIEDIESVQGVEKKNAHNEFDYGSDTCGCGKHHLSLTFEDDLADSIFNGYYGSIYDRYQKAVSKVAFDIAKAVSDRGNGATLQQVQDTVLYNLYKVWKNEFVAPSEKYINEWVAKAYTEFRNDPTPLQGKADAPSATFNVTDYRTINYFKNSDGVYLGRFITDKDTTKKINEYIKERYIANGLPAGKDTKDIEAFRKQFGDVLMGEDWKISRILSTSVGRMKNMAAINYMNQVGIESYKIVGIGDRLQCSYCSVLNGMSFSVAKASSIVDDISNSDPEYVKTVAPFITSIYDNADEMEGKTSSEIESAGFNLVPAHPSCRCRVVADL